MTNKEAIKNAIYELEEMFSTVKDKSYVKEIIKGLEEELKMSESKVIISAEEYKQLIIDNFLAKQFKNKVIENIYNEIKNCVYQLTISSLTKEEVKEALEYSDEKLLARFSGSSMIFVFAKIAPEIVDEAKAKFCAISFIKEKLRGELNNDNKENY